MLIPIQNYTKQNRTLIFLFIHRITSKTMQDLLFFLKTNEFTVKRITKNYAKANFVCNLGNSNFVLENHSKLDSQQLKKIVFFLSEHTSIHGVFFKNQFLNTERILNFETKDKANFWKQISTSNL